MKSPGSLKLVGLRLEEDLCASHDNPRCYPVTEQRPSCPHEACAWDTFGGRSGCVTNCVPPECVAMCNFVCCQIIWSRVWCFARRAGGALCTCDQLVGKGADTPIQTSPPSSDLLALDLPVFSLALVAGGPLLSSCAHRTTGLVFFILLDLCLSCCITKKKTGKMSKRIRRCPIWVLAQCDSRNAQHLHSDC
jgi:hypothetical protein